MAPWTRASLFCSTLLGAASAAGPAKDFLATAAEANSPAALACTGPGADPHSTGTYVACCTAAVKCFIGRPSWRYKCFAVDQAPASLSCDAPTPPPTPTPFYSSGGEEEIGFSIQSNSLSANVIEKIWPRMSATFDEGTGVATAASVSEYTKELLEGPSPFGGAKGSVKIPVGGDGPGDTDQLKWGEYVAYTRRQVCYIAANIAAGNSAPAYADGLGRLIPPTKCDNNLYEAGFKRALIGLLAACSVDPTLAKGAQGPMLVVAKSTKDLSKAPTEVSDVAKRVRLKDAQLRMCRFRDGSTGNVSVGSIPPTPKEACDVDTSTDFMRESNSLHGQVVVDITAAWIGGYILARGGCGGFDGGQDERLMTFMPEVMVLSFFLSQKSSPIDAAGVALLVPAYILGARKIFAGFDGTSRDAGPEFNNGSPRVNAAAPLNSDLKSVVINGKIEKISRASPFLGFQSINQGAVDDVVSARLNRDQKQFLTTGDFAFKSQVAAWYNALSLTSWHPEVQAMLKTLVVAVGSGPWGSGVWWGNSQLFFLVAWIGHSLAAETWGQALPLDYYLYSSFTENPSNQCLVHSRGACDACLKACDNDGYAGPGGHDQRYCCMEPQSWQQDGLFSDFKPCIPDSYAASLCGAKGLEDVYDKYLSSTVADLWKAVEDTLPSVDFKKSNLFDTLLVA